MYNRISRFLLIALCSASLGCGFLRLGGEVELLESNYLLGGMVANAVDYDCDIFVIVLGRDSAGRVVSADIGKAGKHGAFGFLIESPEGQHLAAFADVNRNGRYDAGEPAWLHAGRDGAPAPIRFLQGTRRGRAVGRLSSRTKIPDDLIHEAREFTAGRPIEEVVRGWNIPVQVGEIADLDEERFSAERGEEGLWQPASFPIESGIGIFFLESYDPDKIPVLFVHGAGGSPQNWRAIFDGLDRDRFQPWFYLYATGRRLDEMAGWLHNGVEYLHEFYGFDEMAVVAHSMGGLISRAFLNKHVAANRQPYVKVFVSIATPWAGHEAARSGVENAPAVVPSWHDLATGSEFLEALFTPSKKMPPHHLLFAFRGQTSITLPSSNDGAVSLASQLRVEAQNGAVRIRGYDATHTSVLREASVIAELNRILHNASSNR